MISPYFSDLRRGEQGSDVVAGDGVAIADGGRTALVPLLITGDGTPFAVGDAIGFGPLDAGGQKATGDAALAVAGVGVEPVDGGEVAGLADGARLDLAHDEANSAVPADGGPGGEVGVVL